MERIKQLTNNLIYYWNNNPIKKSYRNSTYDNIYQINGFVNLKGYLNEKQKESLKRYTQELSDMPETSGKWMNYYETRNNKRLLSRMENIIDYHSELKGFEAMVLRPIATRFMNDDVSLFKEKINFKLPGGGAFAHHQDFPAWSELPPTRYITIGVPVDKMTPENGYLIMAPKIHHEKVNYHHPITNQISNKNINSWEWIPIEADLGDIIVFDSYTPHYSKDNLTDKSRRIYYFTYNIMNEGCYRDQYFKNKREKFPPDIEKVPGVDYSKTGALYNLGNPINTKINSNL